MCCILELYFLPREKLVHWETLRKLQIDLWPGTLFISYIHMHIHTLYTHTLPYIKNSMYTICPILWMFILYPVIIVYIILYISLFWCEPTLQVQMAKQFVGCIDFYCKFQGSNYFCLCFIPQTKLCFSFFCRTFCYLMRYHSSTLNCHQMVKQSCKWKILLLFGIR